MKKYKTELYILIGTGLLVLIVFVVTGLNVEIKIGGKNKEETSTTLAGPPPQAPVVDSMADHHRPKPADSATFDNLLDNIAPDFTLESFEGKKYALSSLKGRNVILFFNEGLMCYPACWNQIAAFGKDSELSSKAIVLNINVDPKDEWKSAIAKMPELAGATVLFDTDKTVSQTYGVLSLTSSMHRGEFPGHTYIIVDKEGIVRFAKDDETMAVRNKELLAELSKL